jgi:hypothetical protein
MLTRRGGAVLNNNLALLICVADASPCVRLACVRVAPGLLRHGRVGRHPDTRGARGERHSCSLGGERGTAGFLVPPYCGPLSPRRAFHERRPEKGATSVVRYRVDNREIGGEVAVLSPCRVSLVLCPGAGIANCDAWGG